MAPPTLPEPFRSDPRPVVLVFRAPIFNASETFVRNHATGLARYQPLIVGRVRKGHVPPDLEPRIRIKPAVAQLREFAPALIHAHFLPDGLRALPLARALGVPLITTIHGYDVTRSRASMLRSGRLSWMRYALFQRRLMDEGVLFLAVSEALRRQALKRGYPPERTLTHYLGIDLDRFHPGTREPARIVHVGRLVEKKGTAILLRAFARVRAAQPQARLDIVGDGPLRGGLERLAVKLGLGGAVAFLGMIPPEAIAARVRAATLLAAPSITARGGDAEGLPTTVVEAMASAVPVVATHHSGIPEAVSDGVNGFLVPEGAVEPLALRIAELLADPALAARMGAAGRAIAQERFDAVRQSSRLEAHYDAVIGTRDSL